MATITEIKNKIKDIVEAVKFESGTSRIVVVYKYPTQDTTGYPFAVLTFAEVNEDVHSNRQNLVSYRYKLNVFQEKTDWLGGEEKAELVAEDRTYELGKAFRENSNLGMNDVIRVVPVKAVKDYVGTQIIIRFDIIAQVLENINFT